MGGMLRPPQRQHYRWLRYLLEAGCVALLLARLRAISRPFGAFLTISIVAASSLPPRIHSNSKQWRAVFMIACTALYRNSWRYRRIAATSTYIRIAVAVAHALPLFRQHTAQHYAC